MASECTILSKKDGEYLVNENQLCLEQLKWKGKMKDLPSEYKPQDPDFEPDDDIYVFQMKATDLTKKKFFANVHYYLAPISVGVTFCVFQLKIMGKI
ncbi:hypothetical protein BFJ63_vAg18037 [Fusarium oxysporum f. sp. narcissi]|uniref:Uncharacterized protein n=1 Tax=Fusarium oxysporum f. sp. narcissi TaxID=451672 RepID=A0A4Q2UX68_FUSOX|nr:hypothetical protein BFJ63_vAg18037 [Fusarium oxysporum f. sp. narcissi]